MSQPNETPNAAGTSNSTEDTSEHPIADILRALKHGLGRERVNDANVDELIAMAKLKGETQIEFLLREWRSDCGDDGDTPILPLTNPPPR
jgi:hypothetical protein